MKKIVLALLIIAVCCSSVFASEEKLYLNIVPFSHSIYPTTNKDDITNSSTNGMGLGLGFVTNLVDTGLLVGADLTAAKYGIVDREDFYDFFLTARAGYQFLKNDKFAIEAYTKLGIDFEYFAEAFGFAPIFGLGFETEFKTSEHVFVFAAGEVFASRVDADYKYFAYRFNAQLGFKYAF